MGRSIFTAYPQLQSIDKYSKQIAARLFRKYPQWLPYASVVQGEDSVHLEVAVPAPVRPRERDLLISTYDEQITIHFDRCHAHFGGWSGIPPQVAFAEAVYFLERILREEVVAVGIVQDGPGLGWGLLARTAIPTPPPGTTFYIRSWRGTFDTNL